MVEENGTKFVGHLYIPRFARLCRVGLNNKRTNLLVAQLAAELSYRKILA